jgi:L-fuculose-phosphate aldolase
VARRMAETGLVSGTSGNVSARTAEGEVLITPSGLDYAAMEPGDVVVVDLDGRLLEGKLQPSSETPMHIGIYRVRPPVAGIVHTHSPYATTLACLGWEIPPVHYMLAMLSEDGRVPVAPYATYGTDQLARAASETLGAAHKACLLQNHGTVAIGRSPSEAFSRSVVLEDMAGLYYRAMLAGEPVVLEPGEMAEVAQKITNYGQKYANKGCRRFGC